MKSPNCFFLSAAFFLLATAGFTQHSFSTCSAAYLGEQMIVDDYSPNGKAVLSAKASGILRVFTIVSDEAGWRPAEKIPFQVAVRDGATQTLTLFSKENLEQIDVKKVLAKCKKGDRIVLLTLSASYALPHNEIEVK